MCVLDASGVGLAPDPHDLAFSGASRTEAVVAAASPLELDRLLAPGLVPGLNAGLPVGDGMAGGVLTVADGVGSRNEELDGLGVGAGVLPGLLLGRALLAVGRGVGGQVASGVVLDAPPWLA